MAFDVVAAGSLDVAGDTRRTVRDALRNGDILVRTVRDIRRLLLSEETDELDIDVVHLWDDRLGSVIGGVDYTEVDW